MPIVEQLLLLLLCSGHSAQMHNFCLCLVAVYLHVWYSFMPFLKLSNFIRLAIHGFILNDSVFHYISAKKLRPQEG